MRRLLGLAAILACLAAAVPASGAGAGGTSIFFYPWYGTPARDGAYLHWGQGGHLPPTDIASDFYPARGLYSSGDPAVLRVQMDEIRAAGVDEVVSSWWGWGSLEDRRLPLVAATARRAGLTVAVQIEPYPGRTPATVAADVGHLVSLGIRRFYVYRPFDSADETAWAATNAALPDVDVVAQSFSVQRAARAGFDGVYTYDVVAAGPGWFTRYCRRAHAFRLRCLPSVGPGYEAFRATGDARRRPRRNGAFYDAMWRGAIAAGADRVTITSYNEWHEGTQIEPARTFVPRFALSTPVEEQGYGSYAGAYRRTGADAAGAYLERTAYWARAYRRVAAGRPLLARAAFRWG